MSTYIYREDCGEFEARFDADTDEAAEEHILATWRNPADPDFDGDSGSMARLDWDNEGGEWLESSVTCFDGENMIIDLYGQRVR